MDQWCYSLQSVWHWVNKTPWKIHLYFLFDFFFMATVHDEQPVMGNLLKLLTREEQDSGGSKIDIFLDFESKF